MNSKAFLAISLGLGSILVGHLLEGGHVGSLFQGAAALIVFGGTFGAVFLSHTLSDIKLALSDCRLSLANQSSKEIRTQIAQEMFGAAQLARKESILALEPQLGRFKSNFMVQTLRYVIDGLEPRVIEGLFSTRIDEWCFRRENSSEVWQNAGGYAPTIGILGAVLGLIHVMANLTDTSALGQGIAVAFVATIYGVGSANLLFLPIANRIRRYEAEQRITMEMTLQGAIGIASGLNPHIINEQMKSYIQDEIKMERPFATKR